MSHLLTAVCELLCAPANPTVQAKAKEEKERARRAKGRGKSGGIGSGARSSTCAAEYNGVDGHALDGHALLSSFTKMNGGIGIKA